ncbi:PP2C family protein-serine/threonine phosphatase [Microseira sp. BLCC-F43]|uniref:PP2C family protein-serine/threonine phosphatase n=1 Tax=Microseira sp. BLCC-F43 TaxID=3153602 RepID=UPI0035B75EC2
MLNKRLKAENIRLSAELEVARKLRQFILPKEATLPQIPELEIAGFSQPVAAVGGDYYDILQQSDQIKIGIGNVTGQGTESRVLAIVVQSAVGTLLATNETDPVKFLKVLNCKIYDNLQQMNCDKNLTFVLLDYQGGMLRLSGHEQLIVILSGGSVELIDTIDLGFPLGIVSDIADFVAYADIQLNSGDVVVFYTDGITEAEDINGVQY